MIVIHVKFLQVEVGGYSCHATLYLHVGPISISTQCEQILSGACQSFPRRS